MREHKVYITLGGCPDLLAIEMAFLDELGCAFKEISKKIGKHFNNIFFGGKGGDFTIQRLLFSSSGTQVQFEPGKMLTVCERN